MARIETYTPDYVITPNDKVIGTDGDNSNATKNFPVIAMLDYLGTNFNLQSADLVYNYTIGDENMLLDGQFTSNNRLDTTPLFAGITTLYVSKTTVFGRLIDDYIQTVSDEAYSFMIYDFGDYNRFGFYSIVSAVSLDSDTFTLTVTFNSGNGSLQDGLSHGLKVYPPTGGGSGDNLGNHIATTTLNMANNSISNANVGNFNDINLFNLAGGGTRLLTVNNAGGVGATTNYVTTDTVQNITNYKTFDVGLAVEGSMQLNDSLGGIGAVLMNARGSDLFLGRGSDNVKGVILDMSEFTATTTFTHTVQAQDGTIALLSDIPTDYVTVDTTQSITGNKTFTSPTTIESLVFTQNGDSFLVPFGVQHNNTLGFTFQDNTLGGGQSFSFLGQGLTANRVQTIQNKSGTLAHLSDIPSSPATVAFTPDIIDTTGGATYSHTTATGEYVRTGDLVTFSIAITNIATTGTGSGELRITGLPLSPARTSSALVELSGFIGVNFYQLQARVTTAGNIDFRYQAALDDSMSTLPADTIDAGTAIYISGSIIV